mmetsp:Transcript_39100/g.96856  ORF Transcript_39100/g.96856 Transcript_39100/m.96856 type:complete len:194 (-) Transcript_39100:252-833(-)|eukprot:CAMPEP_0197593846 /NCGR_PEP_ID=MMETSP1326-20131121/19181_1 /TAXON_ID=1155430 /ORGANISM="Genus nov. species nov., Strain RCC2288" /LENGTH=193 /DNA_ID=CAMNT_0043159897 /DNA_START=191 /DNA_END=772 /DNA_ORIENTATION=+
MALRQFARSALEGLAHRTSGARIEGGVALRAFATEAAPKADAAAEHITVNQVAGAPMEVYTRKVVIFSPARGAATQGKAQTGGWKIDPGQQQKWENPLMGWTSTGDPLAHQFNSTLNFPTKESAMAFCAKHGWEYDVVMPQKLGTGHSIIPGAGKAGVRPKSYGDNFAVARKGFPVWPHPGYEFGKEPGTEKK